MATSQKHPQTLRTVLSVLSSANTGRDGTGTMGTPTSAFTGAATGSLVTWVSVSATGSTTDGFIRFFLYDGTNVRFLGEVPVVLRTPTAALMPAWSWGGRVPNWDGKLPSASFELRMSTNNAETFHVCVGGVDY